MTAQTQAQALTITIGGTSYTNYLAELNIGFESWGSRGVIKKTGEIALVSISGGVSLDPRDNSDFDTGNTVTVSGHPLAGSLLILSPPTIEPLLSDIPATSGNLVVKIPVGCRLAYYDAYQPDDDQSGVTLGTGVPGEDVVIALLEAAGIDPDDVVLPEYDREFEYPLQKQGGGFVAMAGDVTYSALDNTRPGFLYCDDTNTIKAKFIDLEADSELTIELGVNDKEYLPQLDGSLPPGTVQAVGVRRRIVTPPTCETTYFEEPDVIKQWFYVCKYEEASLSVNSLELVIKAEDLPMIISTSATRSYVTPYNSEGEPLSPKWINTSNSITYKIFSKLDDYLVLEYTIESGIRGDLNSDLSAASESPETYRYIMETSKRMVVGYSYKDGVLIQQNTWIWLPACVIDPDGFEPEESAAWNLKQSQDKSETWGNKGSLWTNRVSDRQARKLVNPDWVETPGETAFDLITAPSSKTEISSTGSNQPPRPDVWEGLSYEEEDQLQAEARFSTSRQREVLQIPYAFSIEQMQGFAETEGEIMWGRAYQYLIECEPELFNSTSPTSPPVRITAPLPVIQVKGAGEKRTFLADAIQWSHSDNTDYVAFAGIYLGGSSGDPYAPRKDNIAPLIVSPVGTTTSAATTPSGIGAQTPTGNPRPPQASDGLIAVGFLGTVTVGTIGGGVTVT